MRVFITGTDTNVGKTVVSAWLCYHLNYAYWKPIQTGASEGTDRDFVHKINLNHTLTYEEAYFFQQPVSPHLAAELNFAEIDINHIIMPKTENLIIEGAGGVLVPLTKQLLMIDFIKKLNIPVILVARSSLGTINHTLLSIRALKNEGIPILGVIMNNKLNSDEKLKNQQAIEQYGEVPVLACLPNFDKLTSENLKQEKISNRLRELFCGK